MVRLIFGGSENLRIKGTFPSVYSLKMPGWKKETKRQTGHTILIPIRIFLLS